MNQMQVVAAIFVRDGKIMAARRAPHKAAAGFWEFPGGKVEVGEDARAALPREIEEELGVAITVGELIDDSVTVVGESEIRLACYLVSPTKDWPTASSDHDAIEWLSAENINDLQWAEPDLPAVEKLRASWPSN